MRQNILAGGVQAQRILDDRKGQRYIEPRRFDLISAEVKEFHSLILSRILFHHRDLLKLYRNQRLLSQHCW